MLELIQQGKITEAIIMFLLELFITAAAYLCLPAIFCIVEHNKGTTYDLKTIKKITVINGACIWFVFQLIRYNIIGETETSVSGVLLWSFAAYWMMKKVLFKSEIVLENDENKKETEIEILNKKAQKRFEINKKIARIYIFIFMTFVFFASLYCVFQLLDGNRILEMLYFPFHIGSFYMMLFWRRNS